MTHDHILGSVEIVNHDRKLEEMNWKTVLTSINKLHCSCSNVVYNSSQWALLHLASSRASWLFTRMSEELNLGQKKSSLVVREGRELATGGLQFLHPNHSAMASVKPFTKNFLIPFWSQFFVNEVCWFILLPQTKTQDLLCKLIQGKLVDIKYFFVWLQEHWSGIWYNTLRKKQPMCD